MTLLLFFAVLFVLILVHEWGHFIVAKKTGMRVDEFGIGFPPKLFGITWRGTLYTLNLFPIGGFVRIYGENAEDAYTDAAAGKTVGGSFTSKSKWAQSAVLIAGVTMNVLLAWALFVFVFMYGVPTVIDEEAVTASSKLVIQDVLPQSPASDAGLPKGAVIVAYGNEAEKQATIPSAFKAYTAQHANEPIAITYQENAEIKTVSLTPEKGLVKDNQEQAAIGIALALVDTVKQPFGEALMQATETTGSSLVAITKGLGALFVDMAQLDADLSQVAGPVGIVGLVGDAADFGLASLLMFTAIISLNLAVINMLPFPALDGGRLLFVGIEAITRKPINPVWVMRLNTLGFILLITLMIAVTYSDIAKLV
jgi:regulator of sigma E protease